MRNHTVIDCHVHLRDVETVDSLETIRKHCGIDRMSIVCEFGREEVNDNPPAFVAKASYPDRFYMFGGLDHSNFFSDGEIEAPGFGEQVDRLIACGADGVKIIETKPTCRKYLPITIDSDYFEPFFARMEETQFPILWHSCDPEEFWDPDLTPEWAKKRGWGYDETFVPKETLYNEVANVLKRHPNLRIIFAHFFFLSAQLDRAAKLFDRYPTVHFDLAPGVEMLYNMSHDTARTREFFEQYSTRILFGTDIFSAHEPEVAKLRQGIVRRFLESSDEYRIPDGADFLLGPPEDGIMRGLSLSDTALDNIYRANFERLASPRPKPLNKPAAIAECERLVQVQAHFTKKKASDTPAWAAGKRLETE